MAREARWCAEELVNLKKIGKRDSYLFLSRSFMDLYFLGFFSEQDQSAGHLFGRDWFTSTDFPVFIFLIVSFYAIAPCLALAHTSCKSI